MKRLEIDKKRKQYGHNISHSKRHTQKVWKPNLQTKTIVVDSKEVKVKISAAAIRDLKKKGLL